jgi:hypothetical protein
VALIGSYRPFETTCPPHQAIGCPETSLTTDQRCVTSQKSEDLICAAVLA